MPFITLNKSLLLAPAAQVYGVQATPPFARQDAMTDVAGVAEYTLDGVRIVPEAGIMILEPVATLVGTSTADWTFPDGLAWMNATDSGTGLTALYQPDATPDQAFSTVSNMMLPANCAFYARIGRGQPAPGATLDAGHITTTLSVGEDTLPGASDGATPFRLVLQYGRPPFLQQAVPDPSGADDWVWPPFGQNGVVSRTIARSEDLFDDSARVVNVEWLPVASSNVLVVRLANGRDTLVFRPNRNTPVYDNGLTYQDQIPLSVTAGKVRVTGCNGVASVQYLPMRFATSGTLTSPVIALPYPLPMRWFVRTPAAEYDPSTQTVTGALAAVDPSGRLIQYQLTMTSEADSTGYAPLSPVVREVEVDIPATYIPVSSSPALDISAQIAEIEEHQWFDPSTLTVHSEVGINLDNTNGPYPLLGAAHVAAQYARGLSVDGVNGAMFPMVTGWTGFQTTLTRADPKRRFDLVIADRSWQLRRSPVGALPYFDGWCFLAAMHFLANVGAVTDDYLGGQLTSCAFGINPPGCPHMKLAQVQGQRSRVRYPVDWDVWHCITELAGFSGWVVGFDANGVLQTAPQMSLMYSTPYRGTFTTNDIADSADPAYLMTIRDQLSIALDTSPRRTGMSLYASGPNDTPNIAAALDIDDTVPGFVSNIHGFRENRTEQGNLLSDPQFAAAYAGTALARLALPQVMVEFGSYFLPALFPLDRCDVEESVMLQGSVRLNIEDISQTWTAADPSAFHSRIKGRAQ